MTAFKKGDRVKVEYEGIVDELTQTRFRIQHPLGDKWLSASQLTKLHDPLPRKIGAVIRLSTTRRAITVFTLTPSGYWFGAGSNFTFSSARAKQLADEFGFTVLYAGDDE